jgi:hypothetical protein
MPKQSVVWSRSLRAQVPRGCQVPRASRTGPPAQNPQIALGALSCQKTSLAFSVVKKRIQTCKARQCDTLLCFALLCFAFALFCFALLCFALRCFALLCVALVRCCCCFAFLCVALSLLRLFVCVALFCVAVFCFVLICVALFNFVCFALCCFAFAFAILLFCVALCCFDLFRLALRCFALFCVALRCVALLCVCFVLLVVFALRYFALRCFALCCFCDCCCCCFRFALVLQSEAKQCKSNQHNPDQSLQIKTPETVTCDTFSLALPKKTSGMPSGTPLQCSPNIRSMSRWGSYLLRKAMPKLTPPCSRLLAYIIYKNRIKSEGSFLCAGGQTSLVQPCAVELVAGAESPSHTHIPTHPANIHHNPCLRDLKTEALGI